MVQNVSLHTVKPVLSGHSKTPPKMVFNTDYRVMQVKSIAECSKREHSAIFSTFIKLPFSIKTFVLSIFKRLLDTGFTVFISSSYFILNDLSPPYDINVIFITTN